MGHWQGTSGPEITLVSRTVAFVWLRVHVWACELDSMVNSLCSVVERMFHVILSSWSGNIYVFHASVLTIQTHLLIFRPKCESAICTRKKKIRMGRTDEKTGRGWRGNLWSCNGEEQEEGNAVWHQEECLPNASAFRMLAVFLGNGLLTGKPIGLLITVT